MELLDTSLGQVGRDVVLSRVYRHGGDTVRIRVRLNSYADQSFATAYLLNGHKEWTEIAETPSATWHDAASRKDSVRDGTGAAALSKTADELAARVTKILG